MVLPAGVITTLGELALNPKVQGFATNLARNIYGRIMPDRKDAASADKASPPALTLEDLSERIDQLPSREDLIAAFAVLQADIDRQHQQTRLILAGFFAVVLALGGVLVFLLT